MESRGVVVFVEQATASWAGSAAFRRFGLALQTNGHDRECIGNMAGCQFPDLIVLIVGFENPYGYRGSPSLARNIVNCHQN